MSTHPDVPFVNKRDEVIGIGQLSEARVRGFAVRVARLFLIDAEARILLQQRSSSVNDPNTWDCSADGYVDVVDKDTPVRVEDYEVTVVREAGEELGVELTTKDLEEVAYYLFENDWTKVFTVRYDAAKHGPIIPDPEEVRVTQWFAVEEIERLVNSTPDMFEPGLPTALKHAFHRS